MAGLAQPSFGQAVTPLGFEIAALIRSEGPISVERYMALCLSHPVHGYYMTHDPFGEAGDFTTAPEISQMFGELIGIWVADLWMKMGAPHRVQLVEIGPGRGTLMNDALRVLRGMPEIIRTIAVTMIETSPLLAERQRISLRSTPVPILWIKDIDAMPPGPMIIIANELFDALPVRQSVLTERGWCERLIGLDEEGRFTFGLASEPDPALTRSAPLGSLLERHMIGEGLMTRIAQRMASHGGGCLVIDYGHQKSAFGDTLQAIKHHAFADPLQDPGDADLTMHVDFEALIHRAKAMGATIHGPVTQGAFLKALGIVHRAARLTERATPPQADAIAAALARLTDMTPTGMGQLFKVMAVTHPALHTPAGFAAE